MSYEKPSTDKQIPVETMSLMDAEFMDPKEILDRLRALATSGGFDPDALLYSGIDMSRGNPLERGFDGRTDTWAATDRQFEAATVGRAPGEHERESPLYYALGVPCDEPAVLVLDGSRFDSLLGVERPETDSDYDEYGDIHSDLEYRLKPGETFEDAVVGAMRFTD